MLLLGVGGHLQSVQSLRAVLDARREALATQTALELERGYAQARASLRSLGATLAIQGPDGLVWPDGASLPFDTVRVIGADGSARVVWTSGASRPRPASVGAGPVLLRVEQPAGSRYRAVEGILAIDALVAAAPALSTRLGREGFTRVVDGSTGRVLFDSARPQEGEVAGPPDGREGVRTAGPGPTPRSADGDDAWRLSDFEIAGAGWQVAVYTSDDEFVAPFRRSRLLYMAVVLLVLGAAAGVFSMLAQGSLGSLPALIRAADEVSVGNMSPWLPPPGDDDVGRLALAFRKMTDRLQASIRQSEESQKLAAVGELASYLSHEIRNPLSSIRLGLQTLHRDLSAGFIPPDASRIIDISLSEVKRLDGVVRTVLDVGRDHGQVDDGTACDVHATISDAIDVISPRARSSNVELAFQAGADRPWVVGEAEALKGVWLNLIVNALDAVDGRESPRIVISTASDGAGEVQIRVADNGPGVPAEVVDSIFEPSYTTKEKGNGIGLATATASLQAAGGSIVYDQPASVNGAVFLVRLKAAKPPLLLDSDAVGEKGPALRVAGAA